MSKLDVLARQLEEDKKRIAYLDKIIGNCDDLNKKLSGHYPFIPGDPKVTIRVSGTIVNEDFPIHREVELENILEEENALLQKMILRKKELCLAEKAEIEKKYEGWK